MTRKILVYSPINLEIVDGSSVWLRSICETLALIPDTQVDLLVFATPADAVASINGVRKFWYPSSKVFAQSGLESLAGAKLLDPAAARLAISILHSVFEYDYLVVRGAQAAWELSKLGESGPALLTYLTDVSRDLLWTKQRVREREELQSIAERSTAMLFQTEDLANLVAELAPEASQKAVMLPPMIPDDTILPLTERKPGPIRMVYAGKFAPDWAIEELLDAYAELSAEGVPLQLQIFGDKIHRAPDGFAQRMKQRLEAAEGFQWHGAVSRSELLASLADFDIGYAYRRASLLGSPEISTKLLEYVATGVAPVLNRTPAHIEYFGKSYPLFANSKDELTSVLREIGRNGFEPKSALAHARTKIEAHLFSSIATKIEREFERIEPAPIASRPANRKPSVLMVSHDFKFMEHLRGELFNERNFRTLTVKWPRFQGGAEDETIAAMSSADVIFCEWALGNAVTCSRHKRPDQKLIVRFHRFEQTTDLPQQIDIDKVDLMVTVSDHLAQNICELYDWPAEKVKVIPNTIDCRALAGQKTPYAQYNLGLVGFLPRLKRLDLALELLALLRKADDRYMLHVKGKMPWELPWIWKQEDQYGYYTGLFERIRLDRDLAGAVVFDPHGPDVSRWLRKIGWILSLSDIESFHLGGVEGMASGALPVVINRRGADQIFPDRFVQPSIAELAKLILEQQARRVEDGEADRAMIKDHACRYDKGRIAEMWLPHLQACGILTDVADGG